LRKKRKKRNISSGSSKNKSKRKKNRKKDKKIQKKQTSKLDKNLLIQIQNLTKRFHNKEVLKNINLDIKKTEIFGLIGMSGSGKTTLLNLIIGFYSPEAGSIYYNHKGKLIKTEENMKFIHQKFGFAPQQPSFYPKLTTFENLEHFGSLYNISRPIIRRNIKKLLRLTKLQNSKDVLAGELSFGMQKRLGIICALVHKPDVLILDEPTADLDPILREDILNLILRIKQKGITVIIASHFLDDMEELCDRVGIIKNGKILKSSTVDNIKKSLLLKQEVILKTRSRSYTKFTKKLRKIKSLKIKKIKKSNYGIIIQSENPEKVILSIIKLNKRIKQDIVELKINNPNLTALFKKIENE